MITYERGKAPADAPVTWTVRHGRDHTDEGFSEFSVKIGNGIIHLHDDDAEDTVNAICAAFHHAATLRALVEEAVAKFAPDADGFRETNKAFLSDWLSRASAAIGEGR